MFLSYCVLAAAAVVRLFVRFLFALEPVLF